jgi:hypothetical protein
MLFNSPENRHDFGDAVKVQDPFCSGPTSNGNMNICDEGGSGPDLFLILSEGLSG